jgi:replicative DNA helicase
MLLKKYLIVYEDFISKINAYPGLIETTSLLKSLIAVSDKVVALYSQETNDLEKKLRELELKALMDDERTENNLENNIHNLENNI